MPCFSVASGTPAARYSSFSTAPSQPRPGTLRPSATRASQPPSGQAAAISTTMKTASNRKDWVLMSQILRFEQGDQEVDQQAGRSDRADDVKDVHCVRPSLSQPAAMAAISAMKATIAPINTKSISFPDRS